MATANDCLGTALGAIVAFALTACSESGGDAPAVTARSTDGIYHVSRTSWGDPDLQGTWPGTAMVGIPLQRDEKLGTRNLLTDEEFVARESQFARQAEQDNADFEFETAVGVPGDVGSPTSPPPHWLERGQPQRQASLIVDPPNGRLPVLTEQAQQRQAALRAARASRGPADSYTDRSLYDRCITRGLAGSMMPAIYNAGNVITQSPGYVAIMNEMIHETRIVPLDGRPHTNAAIKMWLGDSRGRVEGDTLVVETTNFTDRTGVGVNGGGQRHSEALTITERYTRVADDLIEYEMAVEDPQTWTAPWTMQFPLKRDDEYGMFEYACHEGNLSMFNILSGHRADERAAAGAGSK
jgi:hypothetical protein